MANLTLSLIVPCYNCIDTIDNLINHIPFDQLQNQVEVILINDGSKDSTWTKLQKIRDHHEYQQLIRIYDKPNGNWGSVHNFAKKLEINGKYVKTLDSDDYLDTYGLIKFVDYLNRLPEDIDLVFSNVNFINNKNEIVSQKFFNKLFRKEFFKLYTAPINKMSVLSIHAFCEKTELYKKVPDLPENMTFMDSVLIFYLLYYSNDNCAFFRYAPLYQYQCGNPNQSVSQANLSRNSEWVKQMFHTEIEFAQNEQIFSHLNRKKAHIMGQLLQLGWFQLAYSMTFKNDLTIKQKQAKLYEEIVWAKEHLTNGIQWFNCGEIKMLYLLKCHLFINFIKVATVVINNGFFKATKKNNKRFAQHKLNKENKKTNSRINK